MPRYVLGCRAVAGSEREAASDLAATRFPEVTVDQSFAAHDDDGLDVWVCRAPSENHLRRWAASAGLAVDLLQPVDADGQRLRGAATSFAGGDRPPMQDHPEGREALEGDRP